MPRINGDVYDLSATHGVVIAIGHAFNNANERTAFVSMDTCLEQNGTALEYDVESVENMIIKVALGLIDVPKLTHYLRSLEQIAFLGLRVNSPL